VRHPTFLKISESYLSPKAREIRGRIDERQIGGAQREPCGAPRHRSGIAQSSLDDNMTSPRGDDEAVMKWNYIVEKTMLRAVGGDYPVVRNILKQPAIMA